MELNRSQIEHDYEKLIKELADPEVVSDWERFEELSRKKSQLDRIREKIQSLDEFEKQIAENEGILKAGEDRELNVLANEELRMLAEKKKSLENEIENLLGELIAKAVSGPSSVIVEIRAGVGGEEAALFAQDLFGMYSGLANGLGWQEETLDSSRTELGGLKEIIFELKPGSSAAANRDVFSRMKYEAGVHRVQRVPATEKSGRVHTSTATVAVLMKPKITEMKINPSDLKVDLFNATGPGGQNVNKRKTAVRITHLPSGEVVTSRGERSQLQNKENAMSILTARLLEKKQVQEENQLKGERKSQIGFAMRSEKIRTYNFAQDRLTDHRIKKSWHNLEAILQGKLIPVIDSLQDISGESPAMNCKKTPLNKRNSAGQGVIEGVILLIGLAIIFAFFFPQIYKGVKSARSKAPKVSLSPSPSPSTSSPAENKDSPLCGDVIVIPSSSGKAPFKVTLLATGKPASSPIKGFQWDFNNDLIWDTAVVTQPQDYTFQSPGEHQVKVLVLDESNNSRVCSTTISVLP